MFGGSDSNVPNCKWYQFILQCVQDKSCIIQDLCDHFGDYFLCRDGILSSIKLHQKLTGNVNLHFLPGTVATLLLDRNSFTEISGFDQLTGKHLGYLDIRGSPLEIDLRPLIASTPHSIGNPMRGLRVSAHQISWSLLGMQQRRNPQNALVHERFATIVHGAVPDWFYSSILQYMTVGHIRLTKRDQLTSRSNIRPVDKCARSKALGHTKATLIWRQW